MADTLFAGRCVDGDIALCEAALSTQCFLKLVELGVPFPATATESTSATKPTMTRAAARQVSAPHQQADDRMSGSSRAGQGCADAGQDTSHQNSGRRRYGLRSALPECDRAKRRRPLYADSMQKCYLGYRRPSWYVRRQRLSLQPVWGHRPCAGSRRKGQKPDRMAVRACLRCAALECLRHLYAGAAASLLHGGGRQ